MLAHGLRRKSEVIILYSFLEFHNAHLVFPGGSVVKNPPAIQEPQEMRAPSLCQEDPLEKEMATRSSILAWRMDRETWRATIHGVTEKWRRLSIAHTHMICPITI